jgi:hypothetical protein
MNWWEWVFSGIGALALGLFIDWLRRRSRSSGREAALTAQGAKVSDSPVASGSGINQSIEHHTHHHYGTLATAPPQEAQRPAEPVARQRPLPNTVLTGCYVGMVSQIQNGVWSELVHLQDAFIVQLTNEARTEGLNVGGLVKAQLIYRDGVRELRRITGCWLNQGADMTEFRVNDTHHLMVGLMLGQQFNTVGKRRVRVALGADEVPQDLTPLLLFEQGTVSVQLTHADTGDVLYEGQFQLNTRPPEIIRL